MGGGEINLLLLAKTLVKQGIEVCVLTSYFKGLKKYEKISGIEVIRRLKTGENAAGVIDNFKRSFIFPRSIIKEIKGFKSAIDFDAVHFIGTSIIVAEKVGKILNKTKIFATIESYPALCPKGDRIYKGKKECRFKCSFSRFLKCQAKSSEIGKMKNKCYLKYNLLFLIYVYRYYKRLNKSLKYCRVIAISDYVSRLLLNHGISSIVIPNAVDVKKFYLKKTSKLEKIRIVYLGSLTKYKGPQVLLKAIKGLDCRCDIFGEGILKNKLLKMIKRYKLDAEIHNNVDYSHVPLIYANADIVVFPSFWPEPFGRIAIEAMAAGKPVIGSSIGGIKETIKSSAGKFDAGLLVKAGNVDSLRKAVIMLIENDKLRKNLGKTGKNIVKGYSEDAVIKRLIKLYEQTF